MLRLAGCLALVALLVPSLARASGLSIPDLGASELASGSTGVASPDDLTATYYNPAGLASLRGLHATLDLRAVREELTFQRLQADGSNEDSWQPVSNSGNPIVAPMFGVSYSLKSSIPITIALGGHPANGYSGLTFPDPIELFRDPTTGKFRKGSTASADVASEAPQRYMLISNNSLVYTFDLAVAAKPTEKLEVGVTLRSAYAHLLSRQAIYTNSVSGEVAGYDGDLTVDATQAMVPSATLGASYELPGGLAAGASLELPSVVHAQGTMTIENGPVLDAAHAKQNGNKVDLALNFPWIARAGVKLTRPAFDVELDYTYDAWSLYHDVALTPHDVSIESTNGTSPVAPSASLKGLVDAQSLRLGGALHAGAFHPGLEFLTVRAGILGETSAVPSSETALDQANWERVSASFGLGFKVHGYELVVAYAHFFQPDRQVRDSAVRQTAPNLKPEDATVIGNGDYHANIDVADVALSGAWDL